MNNLDILTEVKLIIKQAGGAVLKFYYDGCEVDYKDDNSPLTQADLTSNEIIVSGLEKFGYGVLSEELTDNDLRLSKKRVWIIDPLDGTKDFVQKTDDFTIMIGLVEEGAPVLGVIYRPAKDELYYAVKNSGAFLQVGEKEPQRICVSRKSDIREARMLSSRFHESESENGMIRDLGIREKDICGSSIKACMIARGGAEINFNSVPKTWEWDVCASDIILHEAGGKMTDTRGQGFVYNKKDPRNNYGYVASNGLLHGSVIGYLKNKS